MIEPAQLSVVFEAGRLDPVLDQVINASDEDHFDHFSIESAFADLNLNNRRLRRQPLVLRLISFLEGVLAFFLMLQVDEDLEQLGPKPLMLNQVVETELV